MKKKFILLFLLLFVFTVGLSQNKTNRLYEKNILLQPFNKITVNSKVTVLLIESANTDTAWIYGSKQLTGNIMLKQKNDELIITTKTARNLQKKGALHIPVNSLKQLNINAAAAVMSSDTLKSYVLNIQVNSKCYIDIAMKGKLNIHESEESRFTYQRKISTVETEFIKPKIYNH
jgi:Putative auto-transporter adhesin, head GIN domain